MTVFKTFNDLFEKMLCYLFLKLSPSSYIGQKVTCPAYLHYENYMLGCLEGLIEAHNVSVARPLQDIEFLHHFTL